MLAHSALRRWRLESPYVDGIKNIQGMEIGPVEKYEHTNRLL